MTPLFKKLNLKPEHGGVLVLDTPASFEPALAELQAVGAQVLRKPAGPVRFGLAFAITQAELDAAIQQLTVLAEGDALLWFAYPKQSSKRYRCEFNRDSGWQALRAAGWDSVRMVALDEDWSALRWRPVAFIGQ